MTDLLLTAARKLGVETSASAGPGGLPHEKIWASWPRQRGDIARDTLSRTLALDADSSLQPLRDSRLWRARSGTWTYTGEFEEAVAMMALHAIEAPRSALRRVCS